MLELTTPIMFATCVCVSGGGEGERRGEEGRTGTPTEVRAIRLPSWAMLLLSMGGALILRSGRGSWTVTHTMLIREHWERRYPSTS